MSFKTPQLPLRQAVLEMIAQVDRSPQRLPTNFESGRWLVDAMQAAITFAWSAAKSFDHRGCSVVWRQGKPVLSPNALGKQLLQYLPVWLNFPRVLVHPVTQVHPAVQILVGALMDIKCVPVSPEELEATCRSNPNAMAMMLNWIINAVRVQMLKTTIKSIIHDFEHRCDEDYKVYSTYFKQVLKANPSSVFMQFELSMLDGYKSKDSIDDTLEHLLEAQKVWVERIKTNYGPAISGFAWRLQETLWAPVIHCVALVDGPSKEERQEFLRSFADEWRQVAGPCAEFFDTCAEGSPFLYRGMAPDFAEFYSKLDRVKHCAIYLTRTQGILRLERNIKRPFGAVGPLAVEQTLRIMEGQIADIKRPRHTLEGAVTGAPTLSLEFRPEGNSHPIFGADNWGR